MNEKKLEIVKILVENGADINIENEFNQTPIGDAVKNGNYNIK